MASSQQDNSWISFSDIMTGLMVIFMFIAIAYILEVQKKQSERDELFKEFKATKENLYHELDSVFRDDFTKWEVELDKDLSIKFTNPEVLFEPGETKIKEPFKDILNQFLPKYFDILLQNKYDQKISEVRIEGHTDTTCYKCSEHQWMDSYMVNLAYSQGRSAEVVRFLRNTNYYNELPVTSERKLQFWLTANGLSYGRPLDENKVSTYESGQPINLEFSRRVEFRIVTTSDKLVEQVLKEISKE